MAEKKDAVTEAERIIAKAKEEAARIVEEAQMRRDAVDAEIVPAPPPRRPVKMVTIQLFKDSGRYADDVTVGVNGKVWKIQRGVPVQVPEYVAEVLERSLRQDQKTAALISRLSNEYRNMNI